MPVLVLIFLSWKGLNKRDIGKKGEPFQLTVTTCDCHQRGTLPAARHCTRVVSSGAVGPITGEADGVCGTSAVVSVFDGKVLPGKDLSVAYCD